MRKRIRIPAIAATLLVIAGFATVFVRAQTSEPQPDFYFTRLAYTETGERGWGWAEPWGYICPEFGGGSFFPQQSLGWGMDYPGADCKFMGGINRLTGLEVHPNPNVIPILGEELFKFPYAYIVEPGGMNLTEAEAARLREYLLRGGFIHVDDFWGSRELSNFQWQMKKVFPDKNLEVLSLAHPVFHTFFDIDEIIQVPGQRQGCSGGATWEQPDDTEARIYGISDDDGRLMVVATYNSDLGDAWEYMDLPCYPARHSGQAYRLGMDFIIYSMTR